MTATSLPRDQTAYRHPVDEVVATLDTDPERGLSQGEARARLDRYGRNELTGEKPVPAWQKFLAQFHDVLVVFLLIATAISAGLWLYELSSALPYEAMAILAVVLLNAVMGYVQQSRAEQAVAALRQMSAADARPAGGWRTLDGAGRPDRGRAHRRRAEGRAAGRALRGGGKLGAVAPRAEQDGIALQRGVSKQRAPRGES